MAPFLPMSPLIGLSNREKKNNGQTGLILAGQRGKQTIFHLISAYSLGWTLFYVGFLAPTSCYLCKCWIWVVDGGICFSDSLIWCMMWKEYLARSKKTSDRILTWTLWTWGRYLSPLFLYLLQENGDTKATCHVYLPRLLRGWKKRERRYESTW